MSETQHDDSPDLVKQLRSTIDRLQSERDELKGQVRGRVLGDTFKQFGLDPNKGPGKFVAQAYDGDLSSESVSEFLASNGFAPQSGEQQDEPPAGMQQRVAQRQRIDQIERDGTPPGSSGQKMSKADHLALAKTDPEAAVKAMREGRVEGLRNF